MGTGYLVTAVEECAECGGTGYVEHPEWVALRGQVDVSSLSDEQIEAWFASNGYVHVPDEEARCYECGGSGTFEREVSLSQALAGSYRELEMRVDELEERLAVLPPTAPGAVSYMVQPALDAADEGGGPVVSALRMTSDLVRELRVMAGFGADGPSTNARMAERMDALEQNATVMNEAVAFGTIDLLALIEALKQRLVLLEERLAVLEEYRTMPEMTPAQYIALRS